MRSSNSYRAAVRFHRRNRRTLRRATAGCRAASLRRIAPSRRAGINRPLGLSGLAKYTMRGEPVARVSTAHPSRAVPSARVSVKIARGPVSDHVIEEGRVRAARRQRDCRPGPRRHERPNPSSRRCRRRQRADRDAAVLLSKRVAQVERFGIAVPRVSRGSSAVIAATARGEGPNALSLAPRRTSSR